MDLGLASKIVKTSIAYRLMVLTMILPGTLIILYDLYKKFCKEGK